MRPEHEKPPELYYDDLEAQKYTTNSRIQRIQRELTERALELLNLGYEKAVEETDSESDTASEVSLDSDQMESNEEGTDTQMSETPRKSTGKSTNQTDPSHYFILDIGCGSGLSSALLDEYGYQWVGMDISPHMLGVARSGRDAEDDEDDTGLSGDFCLQDIGQGMGFRPGTFDGAISISCIQWLCNADKSSHSPHRRLLRFFSQLHTALKHGARAIFQFYPENAAQTSMITSAAMQAGFGGGLVVDYPNSTKRKKYFLCLHVSGGGMNESTPVLPMGLSDTVDDARTRKGQCPIGQRHSLDQQRRRMHHKKQRGNVKDKQWVMKKKDLRRKRGQTVKEDSRYTARKRPSGF